MMKRILLTLTTVLALTLVACGNTEEPATDISSEIEHPLANVGVPFTALPMNRPVSESDFSNWLPIPNFEYSFSEEHGVILLVPDNLAEEPWLSIFNELNNGYYSRWRRLIEEGTDWMFGPGHIYDIFIIANPFNADLFWLKHERGSTITYNAFDPNNNVYEPTEIADTEEYIPESVLEDYDCFQATEFPTDWIEMFELSYCDWFGDVEIENVGTPSGGVWYRHPVIDEIILIWPHSHHRAYDGTVSMILPISVFMEQDYTTVAEVREIFGSELEVAFSDFNGRWMARFDINDYFNARIYLENEYDENITQLIVNRGQRWRPVIYEPTLRDFTGHELVGRWQFVASYGIFGDRNDESEWPEESRIIFFRIFNVDGLGYDYRTGHQESFAWNVVDDEIHETWILGAQTRVWFYELDGDVLREIFISSPEYYENVQGAENLEVFKYIREFVRVD